MLYGLSQGKPLIFLRPIEAQHKWVKFVQACEKRVVNPNILVISIAKESTYDHGQSSQTGHGGGGCDHGQSSEAQDGSNYQGHSSQGREGSCGYESGHSIYAHTRGDGYESDDGGQGLG